MLKNSIGENAGIIWEAIKLNSDLSIDELENVTGLNSNDLHLALGWLSREDKISFFNDENEIRICLNYY